MQLPLIELTPPAPWVTLETVKKHHTEPRRKPNIALKSLNKRGGVVLNEAVVRWKEVTVDNREVPLMNVVSGKGRRKNGTF